MKPMQKQVINANGADPREQMNKLLTPETHISLGTKNLIALKLKEKAKISRESLKMKLQVVPERTTASPNKGANIQEEELATPTNHDQNKNEGFVEKMGKFRRPLTYSQTRRMRS